MGKRESGNPSDSMSWTSTLATTSAESRSDHPTSRISNFTGREATVQHCVGELVEDTGVFPGWRPSTRFSFWGPGTAASASRYSTPANASGGGNGAGLRCRCRTQRRGRRRRGRSPAKHGPHRWNTPEGPSTAANCGGAQDCGKASVHSAAVSATNAQDWISVIAESCDSFQPP